MPAFELPKLYDPDFAIPGRQPRRPVEIDSNEKINKDTVFASIFNLPAPVDIVYKNKATPDATGVTLESDPFGRHLSLDGSHRVDFTTVDDFYSSTQEYTFLFCARINSFDDYGGLFAHNKDLSLGGGIQIQRDAFGTGMRCVHDGTTAVFSAGFTTSVVADSQYHVFLITHHSGSNVTSAYMDGELKGTATNATAIPALAGPLRIGSARDNVYTNGDWYFFASLNRGVSAAEAVYLSKNPYQILKPKTAQIYSFSTGAAPSGRIMGGLAGLGGLAGRGGLAGTGGGLAG